MLVPAAVRDADEEAHDYRRTLVVSVKSSPRAWGLGNGREGVA